MLECVVKCKACGTDNQHRNGQWWHLSGYFGLVGHFCPDCYDKVSHDSYRQPRYPGEYMKILLKLSGEKHA